MKNLTKSQIFLMLCLSLVLGVFCGKYIDQKIGLMLAGFFTAMFTLSVGNRLLLAISLCGFAFLFGSFWLHTHNHPSDLANYYGQKISVTGTVTEEPDERADKTLLTVSGLSIEGKRVSGKIILFTGKYPEFAYGDQIDFNGKIQEPNAGDETDKFSYRDYLSRFGIDAVSYYPSITKTGERAGNRIKFYILAFKELFLAKLALLIPEPANGFLGGILVGAKRGMPEDLLDAFAATGTSHIIAISGFNITIIAQVLDRMLSRFGRRISFVLALACIGLFVVLTGASASVVRAALMGGLLLLAQNVGRLFVIDNALALTAAVMLLINPKILRFDVGFQLSFLALMGLVYLSPILEKRFDRWPEWIKKYFLPTIAAQITTLPVIMYHFERLSLIAPVANLVVLPLVPWMMLFGFAAGAAGLVFVPAAKVISWPAILLLDVSIKVIESCSRIPLASVRFSVEPILVSGYYSVLAGVLIFYNKRHGRAH